MPTCGETIMPGPHFFRTSYDLSANIRDPKMVRIHIEKGIASCATGYDRSVLTRSAGEAIERHLNFCDPNTSICRVKLSQLHSDIAKWFRATIPADKYQPDCERHAYHAVEVLELASNKTYLAPLVAFTLGISDDDSFYGTRDSSGTALHLTPQNALENSRNEYCERQALSLFWYYGHCLSYTKLSKSSKLSISKEVKNIINSLIKTGDIYLLDISLIHPVRTILAIYINASGPVYFSAGAAGHESVNKAIEKSLLELYQAYTLMSIIKNYRVNDIADKITAGYLTFNNNQITDKMSFIFSDIDFRVDEFTDSIDFICKFTSEKILVFNKEIKFSHLDHCVYFTCLKGMNGFSTMTLNEELSDYNKQSANHYGYSQQINYGPIPFA
jgi:YcaO cyclodehydratase, ATP-ad Mg2+-binding